jgi:hypothetical protein
VIYFANQFDNIWQENKKNNYSSHLIENTKTKTHPGALSIITMEERTEETNGLEIGSCCFFGLFSVEELDC